MAPFNPDVPNTNDPSYLGLSRPISPFQGDQSYEALFKGVGDTLKAGVKTADFLVKDKIQNDLYSSIDKERESYMSALEYEKDKVMGRPMDITAPVTKQQVPTDLENLGNYVENLKGSRDANKTSDTYYKMRLLSVAKSFREQYPGYREYIDKTISGITGFDPANAVLTALATEVNQYGSQIQSEKKNALELVEKNIGLPNAPLIYHGIQTGQLKPLDAIMWTHERAALYEDFKFRKAKRESLLDNEADAKIKSIEDVNHIAAAEAKNYFQDIILTSNLGTGKNVTDLINRFRNGEIKLNSEELLQLGHAVKAGRSVVQTSLWNKFNEIDKTGKSLASRIGPKETQEILDKHLILFDQVSKDIGEGRLDLAIASAEFAKAKTEDTKYNLLSNKDTGWYFSQIKAITDLGGPEFSKEFFTKIITDPKLLNIEPSFKKFVETEKLRFINQDDIRATGKPRYLKDAVNEAESKGIKDSKVYSSLTDITNEITNPKAADTVKLNIAKSAFGEGNRGFLEKFQRDSTDPKTGRVIPGKFNLFSQMTSPTVTEEIFRLGKSSPQVIRDYVNWAQESFGTDLLKNEIQLLNEVQSDPSVKLTWNSDTHQIGISVPGSVGVGRVGEFSNLVHPRVRDAVEKLNLGLSNLSNVAKASGVDVNAYLIKQLKDSGYKEGKVNPISFPDQLLNAVKSSDIKASQYAPEDGGVNLKDWLKNPTGNVSNQKIPNKGELVTENVIPKGIQATNLPAEAKALLDTISNSESPGYDVRYGGKRFSDFSKFPDGGAVITAGPNKGKTSSASGRYQFIRRTWENQAKKLGLEDFSPANQDVAAWDLAQTAYSRKHKGRSLLEDIRDPDKAGQIARALSGEWTSLPGGIETNKAGRQFVKKLIQNLRKYQDEAHKLNDEEFDIIGDLPTQG